MLIVQLYNHFGREEWRYQHKSDNDFGKKECRYQHRWQEQPLRQGRVALPAQVGRRHPMLTEGSTMDPQGRLNAQDGNPSIRNDGGMRRHHGAGDGGDDQDRSMVVGLDVARYSTNSGRVGGATKLLNAGADRLVIKLLGRWLSNTFDEYPMMPADGTNGCSSLCAKKERW